MQFTISLLSVILSAFNMHNKVMNAMIVKPVHYRHTRAMKPYKQLLLLRDCGALSIILLQM